MEAEAVIPWIMLIVFMVVLFLLISSLLELFFDVDLRNLRKNPKEDERDRG